MGSLRFGKKLAADEPAADLGGAGADLVELGVAPETPGWRLVYVAHAAHRLDRLAGHPGGLFGGIQDRARGILSRRLSSIQGLPYRVDIRAAGGERGVHVGDLSLHQLEFADRLAELLALVHVGHHDVEAGGPDAERAPRGAPAPRGPGPPTHPPPLVRGFPKILFTEPAKP